ncbi:LCP family protein [Gordonia phosphorivorans]|uniref:LCP family protein n=1 Tax=Gordonia phosphorivorans TaxID=1056982 RepID=A0ABV6H3U4_9ACTN
MQAAEAAERTRDGKTGATSTRSRSAAGRTSSAEIHTRPRRAAAERGSGKPPGPPGRPTTSGPRKRPPGKRRRVTDLLPYGRGLIAVLTVVVLVVTGYGWSRISSLNSSVTLVGGLGLGGGADGAMDILLVGTDSRLDAKGEPLSDEELKWLRVGDEITTSTDTILLIRIPNDGSTATAISIPRDSYVDVPGIGMSKINAAYGSTRETVRRTAVESGVDEKTAENEGIKAGRKALIDSVANLTGVTVDHYAEVGLLGFALLTDAVGGVDVCLKKAVREPLSGARFRAGRQTLNGPKALSFVRQRHDLPRGDLDRITRQQVYMASLAQSILSTQTLTNPSKLSELETAVSRSVVIDDGWDILNLANSLKDLSGGDVKFTTIPVISENGWSDDGTQSVVEVDPAQVKTFVDRQLGAAATGDAGGRGGVTVDVVNAGTVDGLAANVAGLLTAKGYREGETSSKPMNEFDSIIFARSVDNEGAKQLAKDLGGNIEIREDSSLPDDKVRAVLTNTYTGLGAIWNTGPQGENAKDTTAASTPSSTAKAPAAIKADTDGPVCVN